MSPYEVLSGLPYFAALPIEQIEALCMASEVIHVERGQVVIEEGTWPDGLLVVAEGTFEATRSTPDGEIRLGDAAVGEVLGEMSILENQHASATVRALEPGTLVKVPVDLFRDVLSDPVLLGAMVRTITQRLRERESALFQNEKLASLGVLSAGLLHEVNNPAAAIGRAAQHLATVAEELVPRQQPFELSALQRSKREREMTEFLNRIGAERSVDLSTSLVSQGWTPELVAGMATDPAEQLKLAQLVHARQLALEVGMAATRITDLVNAVKRWTYTGQGPVQDVNLNQVILDSCTLLKAKASASKVELDLAEKLPDIEGRGVELSQVITNLLDNALDAAATRVKAATSFRDHEVIAEISDDGAGIPADQVSRIWEPFFTTKAPGVGSGIGLPISRRIIADHGGRIEVESRPGLTMFRVHLPTRSDVADSADSHR
ncbi:MAG: ATP-binding protein [Acidimicrobiia bacterium]